MQPDNQDNNTDWFESLPHISAAQKPRLQRIVKHRLFVTVLVLIVFIMVVFMIINSNKTTCLTNDDYRFFYGSDGELSSYSPSDDFFTTSYDFETATATLSEKEIQNIKNDASRIAKFLESHPNKPVVISLSAGFESSDVSSKQLVESRLAAIRLYLNKANIPDDTLSVSLIENTAIAGEETPDTIDIVSLAVRSVSDCK